MRNDLKSIRMIRVLLLLISIFLLLWTVYDHRSAFMKGWYAQDELESISPRYQDGVFANVISKPLDSLHIAGKSGYVFKLQKSDLVTGTVYNLHQDHKMLSFYEFAIFMIGLSILIVGLKVFSKLYYFLGDSAKGEIFTLLNINRIKGIGFSCILLSVLLWVGDTLAFLKQRELFSFTDYQVNYDFDFNYTLLAAGMLTMVIMFVFKKGYELQQEHELTI